MSDLVKAESMHAFSIGCKDKLPAIGEWFWMPVEHEKGEGKRKRKVQVDTLMCVSHVASNHICFEWFEDGCKYGRNWRVGFAKFYQDSRPEPNWREVLQKRSDEKQKEIREAVSLLSERCSKFGLIGDAQQPASMLPSTVRVDPKEHKKELIDFKEKGLPELKENIEVLTQDMVHIHQSLYFKEKFMADKIVEAAEGLDQRLFALELYAGFEEGMKQVATGQPAPITTPIVARQMLRYMDEEMLYDFAEKGGANHEDIPAFDAWLAHPENRDRLLPEPRCVVAFKVRRKSFQYDRPSSLMVGLPFLETRKPTRGPTWPSATARTSGASGRPSTLILVFCPRATSSTKSSSSAKPSTFGTEKRTRPSPRRILNMTR
jgi:hypothetical protein